MVAKSGRRTILKSKPPPAPVMILVQSPMMMVKKSIATNDDWITIVFSTLFIIQKHSQKH